METFSSFLPGLLFILKKTEDALMFGMFFIIALVNGVLTSRVRRQERLTSDREERTNALYQLTKQIGQAENMKSLVEIAVNEINKHFGLETIFVLQDGSNHLAEFIYKEKQKRLSENDLSVAEWVFRHSRKAGKFTDTLPSNNYTFYPLTGNSIKPGIIAVFHQTPMNSEMDEFWNTFLTQISNAVEREFLDELARKAHYLDESDKLYKTLFNSISHELRIPVSTIMGGIRYFAKYSPFPGNSK